MSIETMLASTDELSMLNISYRYLRVGMLYGFLAFVFDILLQSSCLRYIVFHLFSVFGLSQSTDTYHMILKTDWIIIMAGSCKAIVFTPIIEEFFFRGILYAIPVHLAVVGGMRKGSMVVCFSVLSASVFALLHFNPSSSDYNLDMVVYCFFSSFLYIASYELSGTLLAPMFAHAFYNALVIFVAVFSRVTGHVLVT